MNEKHAFLVEHYDILPELDGDFSACSSKPEGVLPARVVVRYLLRRGRKGR